MLSKKFYDALTILYVIIIIGLFLLQFYFVSNIISTAIENSKNSREIMDIGENPLTLKIVKISTYILMAVYYIFILVLAIQLHSRKQLSMANTVVIAIVIPLAPIFYLFTLRKVLK